MDMMKKSNVLSCICELLYNARYYFPREKFIQPLNYMVCDSFVLFYSMAKYYQEGRRKNEVKPTKMLWETSFHSSPLHRRRRRRRSSSSSLLHNNFFLRLPSCCMKKKILSSFLFLLNGIKNRYLKIFLRCIIKRKSKKFLKCYSSGNDIPLINYRHSLSHQFLCVWLTLIQKIQ